MRIEVCMPNMGKIPTEVVGSLISMSNIYKDIEFRYVFPMNSLIYDARNRCINEALRDNADYLLFIDSDIYFHPDALQKALSKNADVVAGIYYGRVEEHEKEPIIYSKIRPASLFHNASSDIYYDAKDNATVRGCGMGFCLIKREVLLRMVKRYKSPFEPYKGLGEDLSFCHRLSRLHIPIIACECGLLHIGTKKYGKKTS